MTFHALAGGAFGLLVGLLVGMSVSPVVGPLLAVLAVAAVVFLGLREGSRGAAVAASNGTLPESEAQEDPQSQSSNALTTGKPNSVGLEMTLAKPALVRVASFCLATAGATILGAYLKSQDPFRIPLHRKMHELVNVGFTTNEAKLVLLSQLSFGSDLKGTSQQTAIPTALFAERGARLC